MSLALGIVVLAFAVLLGGLAAQWREAGQPAIPAIRRFAVVAAVTIALLHLLPEAIGAVGYGAIVVTVLAALAPAVLERVLPSMHASTHKAPTTALAMGYAAVIAHQMGEGAALASLARSGSLAPSLVLAIAAHTTPLAMVVAVRVLEVKGENARLRRTATGLALVGVASATAVGALLGSRFESGLVASAQPWVLAVVAGLLLHSLSHDHAPHAEAPVRMSGRIAEAVAGLLGLAVGAVGLEKGGVLERLPWAARSLGALAVAVGVVVWSLRADTHGHAAHDHAHH